MTMDSKADNVEWFLDAFEQPFSSPTEREEPELRIMGHGTLSSFFASSDLATASVAAAGRAAARVAATLGLSPAFIDVDRRLASLWFTWTIDPIGWEPPSPWDDLAGIYQTSDGWLRLHTNVPHHRAAALSALGPSQEAPDAAWIRTRVAERSGDELETAIVNAGGCAAKLRTELEWSNHDQGSAVAAEPLAHVTRRFDSAIPPMNRGADGRRPLRGVRVLDLTRVLAGPIATRFLAGLGADVLRLDPPGWDEPGVIHEVTRGKRCGRLDLGSDQGRRQLIELLEQADIMVHGYRGDALDRLGLGETVRKEVNPDLVDVSLNAYGSTGPWRFRRGFDSLVQMSCGIAHTGGMMTSLGSRSDAGQPRPKPLPVQALDHATGYLMATAALHGWAERWLGCGGLTAKVSLARTAKLLLDGPRTDADTSLRQASEVDWEGDLEETSWGPARRLRPPLVIDGVPFVWDRPATALGTETDLSWS